MNDFNFIGRADGIGNRVEEIIAVSAFCHKRNMTANYVWAKGHDILLTAENVSITREIIIGIPNINKRSTLERVKTIDAAKDIKPTFNIHFENQPVGVHIRGTDRINDSGHPHYMRDKRELRSYISRAAEEINMQRPKYVFVCSEARRYRRMFIRKLDKGINVVSPVCDRVPGEYRDFFALTLCSEVYMCSRFSSFAIVASLIGGVVLTAFVHDVDVAARYGALFRYLV